MSHAGNAMSGRKSLLYVAAQGDVVHSLTEWAKGKNADTESAYSYSGNVFSFCDQHKIGCTIFSPFIRLETKEFGDLVAENILNLSYESKFSYFKSIIYRTLNIYKNIIKLKPNYILLTYGAVFPIICIFFLFFRVKVVFVFHNCATNIFIKKSVFSRLYNYISMYVIKSVSSDIFALKGRTFQQVEAFFPSKAAKVHAFLPGWPPNQFPAIQNPGLAGETCRLLYVGRIEHDKGVFDLIACLNLLNDRGGKKFVLDIIGNGGAREALLAEIDRHGLAGQIEFHGHQPGSFAVRKMQACDIVVVPTRTEFEEGLNKVVLEAALCGKPVVTSKVCPAIELLGPGAVEAEPDSPASYADAIHKLANDSEFYSQVAAHAADARSWLLNHPMDLKTVLEAILD